MKLRLAVFWITIATWIVAAEEKPLESPGELTELRICGSYVIRNFRDQLTGDGAIEITAKGERVFGLRGAWFAIGQPPGEPNASRPLIGQDLTGSGAPHVVIYEFTVGAHCCYFVRVLELGEPCRLLATLEGRHSPVTFHETVSGKPWEVHLSDWAFAYWPHSFADSHAPEVILRWNGTRYAVAADRMKKPAPGQAELGAWAAKVKAESSWTEPFPMIPYGLYKIALDLMYGGNEEAGWKFIELAWNPARPGKDDFIAGLKRRLAESPYWAELVKR